jgi:serine/threonine protein kinase
MELAKYEKIQKLGNGYFGEVWKVKRDPPSSEWQYAAMKIIKDPEPSAWNEVDLLKKSQHKHVIKYYDSFKGVSGNLCIVMEYCDMGTLTDKIGVSMYINETFFVQSTSNC